MVNSRELLSETSHAEHLHCLLVVSIVPGAPSLEYRIERQSWRATLSLPTKGPNFCGSESRGSCEVGVSLRRVNRHVGRGANATSPLGSWVVMATNLALVWVFLKASLSGWQH